MTPAEEKLHSVQQNLTRLLRMHTALEQENALLKNQIEAQRKGFAEKNKKIEELEKQLELIKTAQAIAQHDTREESPEARSAMRKQINELIKEIDKCISLLSS